MRRWGQIAEDKPDSWYKDLAKKVYRPDIYTKAAETLIGDKLADSKDFPDFASETGFKPVQSTFIDGISYDGKQPNAYIDSFDIGLKSGQKL